MNQAIDVITTPIGRYLLAASERGLSRVAPHCGPALPGSDSAGALTHRHLEQGRAALDGYFAGRRSDFLDLELDAPGTPFQRLVWDALRRIPFGTTLSYGELARRIGREGAARAVGAANGSNPLAIVVPCHRVVGANGALTGYAHGVERKRWLLDHERARPVPTRRPGSLAARPPVRSRADA
jgi:methylated-DNA-[protein]-cysteine S-methyltransferase